MSARISTCDIHIRDPFVFPSPQQGRYYLFGTQPLPNGFEGQYHELYYYRSGDLTRWEGPFVAFRREPNFWADRDFWAPEVHQYRRSYYMFVTFKAKGRARGTQILIGDSLDGPFVPHSVGPITPAGCECLDGTLYVDARGDPWMVFCHEWCQIKDGTICAVRLSTELDRAIDEPTVLFRGSQGPWATPYPEADTYVTDGPFLHRGDDGSLLMLWSSFRRGKYALGVARSQTGEIIGPWQHESEPLFDDDGGHGMLFHTLEGQLMLALHKPNRGPDERAHFCPVSVKNGKLHLK